MHDFKKPLLVCLNGSDVASSEIIIVFHGKLHFSDTVSRLEKHKSEQYHLRHRKSLNVIKCLAAKLGELKSQPPTPAPTPKPKPSTPPTPLPGPSKPPKVRNDPGSSKPKPRLQVMAHGVSKRVLKIRQYKCPAGCEVVSKSQRDLNQHVYTKYQI